MKRGAIFFVLVTALVALTVAACGRPRAPNDDGGGARVIPVSPIVDVSCILLRLAHSGRVDEICATAEEIAPYVPDILADRAESADAGADDPQGPTIAFSFSEPCIIPKKPRRKKDAGAAPSLVVRPIGDASAPHDAARE